MMRHILILASVVALSLTTALAQKNNIKEAKRALSQQPAALSSAKTAIDAAISDPTTSGSAEAWYVHGQVYLAIGIDPEMSKGCSNCLETAYSSFLKAEELDTRKEFLLDIEAKRLPAIRQAVFDQGVAAFGANDYKTALERFEFVLKLTPDEVAAIQNAAYSAENGKDWVKADKYYRDLIRRKESSDKTYASLARISLQLNDTALALEVLKDGRIAYPDSIGLLLSEINIYLASGKGKEALAALEVAVTKDPQNASLFLAMGSVYESMARPVDADGNPIKPPSDQSSLLAKAKESYQRGLQVDPGQFELNFNMGAMLFNEGTEVENAANNLTKESEFAAAKAKSLELYRLAEPFLEKAQLARPEDESVLSSLKMLYFRTKEDAKYNAVKAKLDSLK